MIDKEIDEKEALELEKIYNLNLEKTKEIEENTQFKLEDVFGNKITKHSFSPVQTTKQSKFLARIM